MNERDLRRALQRAGGVDPAARERSWRVIQAAYRADGPRRRRRSWLSLALASAAMAVAGAGAAAAATDTGVERWVRGVLGVGEPGARPSLVRVPGGGRLLVQAGGSAWLVSEEGVKRRLGAYSGASWSPRGLFVIAWDGRVLSAVDPRGRVRWSLARPQRISVARWGAVDGFRIAYVAGRAVRIVNGDGTNDRRHGTARSAIAPAWRPDDDHVLAHVDARGRIAVTAVDDGGRLWRSRPLRGAVQLAWTPDGAGLLAVTRRRLLLFDRSGGLRASRALPAGVSARAAAWAPRGARVAVVRRHERTRRSDVVLIGFGRDRGEERIFAAPGSLGAPAWSPDGRRLLVPWPAADQWLFLRMRGSGRLNAVARIASQFAPGATRPRFPTAVEWCCAGDSRRGP